MIDTVRRLLLGLMLVGLTGLAFAQDKDKDKPKDKTEPLKGKNQELIVGTWATEVPLEDMKKIKVKVKFNKDNTFEFTFEERPAVKGKYKFTDDETMEVEYTEGEKQIKEVMKVKAAGKKLSLTSEKKKTQDFDRVD
jgi:hypothetical protein